MDMQEEVQEPKVGLIYDPIENLVENYRKFAKKTGFEVCKRSSRKGDDGEMKYQMLVCSHFGKEQCNSKNVFKLQPVRKTDCKARLSAAALPNRKWIICSFFSDHNHEFSSPSETRFYKSHRVLQPYVKRKLEVNDKAGIKLNNNFNSLVVEAGGHEKLTFTEKDCRNYIEKIRRLRLGEGDAIAVQEYFSKMQNDNSSFFYRMDLDEEGHLKILFWVDARSRAAFQEFGDVVTFDTTYLTNKYDMPFAPFVGVNHHGQSILLGCGLISNEDTETFKWLFQSWLTCMSSSTPNAIITDQDKAMKKAIEIVFPNSRHRWCLWHIMTKIPHKLQGYTEYMSIKATLKSIVHNSLTVDVLNKDGMLLLENMTFTKMNG